MRYYLLYYYFLKIMSAAIGLNRENTLHLKGAYISKPFSMEHADGETFFQFFKGQVQFFHQGSFMVLYEDGSNSTITPTEFLLWFSSQPLRPDLVTMTHPGIIIKND